MYCKNCNIITDESICPNCKGDTQVDIPTVVHWCASCNVPVIKDVIDKDLKCPICNGELSYLTSDARPVFPEERLLIEIVSGTQPMKWHKKNVWCNENRYYVDGKRKTVSFGKHIEWNIDEIILKFNEYKNQNTYEYFNEYTLIFCKANKERLAYLENEAFDFVNNEASNYGLDQLLISFSGGKDSTVVADVVKRALSNPQLVNIFGDTTLEFPMTYEYVQRYKKDNPRALIKTARNDEQNFYDVCKDIGPPARMMRWCCTMFKTGPITRSINSLFRGKNILTFYGIRKSESVSRSKYDRVADGSEVKIQKQTVASPIFYWSDIDIWLYMLSNEVDFNDAYRLGYDRVGCWCCPNNNYRAQFLSRIYMPKEAHEWREYLIDFAKSIGKPDAEEYVDGNWWKARQGGNGVKASEGVKIKFTNCTAEENAKIYSLSRNIEDEFYELFIPIGKVRKELGKKIINEVLVLDTSTNVPIISIQPFNQNGYDYSVKIKTMNVANHADLQRMIGYQIRKYNACRKCMKCESVCQYGAIKMTKQSYRIDEKKCVRCKKCITAKYLTGGCLMEKFLKVRKDS